jgi:hypothetical protein
MHEIDLVTLAAIQHKPPCVGTAAPIFPIPKYPAGEIINDPVVGKFYWWTVPGYCEFRDDGIWIFYGSDNQPHYYSGRWVRLDKDHLITGHKYSYRIEIACPSGMGVSNYNETLMFTYNSDEDRLHLIVLDEVTYEGIEAWISRYNGQ